MAFLHKMSPRVLQSSRLNFSTLSSNVSVNRKIVEKQFLLPIRAISNVESRISKSFCSIKSDLTVQQKFFCTKSDFNDDAGKAKKVVNVGSSKMPMSIKSLIERRPKDSTFPKLYRLTKVSREFAFASLTVDQTEEVLRRKILLSKAKKNLQETNHISKTFLGTFMSSPVKSVERRASLDSLFRSFENLVKEEESNLSKGSREGQVKIEKTGSTVNRISYYTLVIRLAFAIENALRHSDQVQKIKFSSSLNQCQRVS